MNNITTLKEVGPFYKRILNTTTLNMALGLPGMSSTMNDAELLRVRVIAIVSSGISGSVGIIALFYLMNYDRRKRLFRHELILFLIVCDFLKAVILLLYPLIILINSEVYATPVMIQVLGWFTSFSIEGADFAILFFAIHFALLIFKPNWKWRNKKTGNIEGGLYKYRNFIWPTTLLIPSIMSSLVFIDFNTIDEIDPNSVNVVLDNNNYSYDFKPRRGGYKPWTAWCYLPARPLWYKYVLSWGPRYFLILFCIGLYLAIYIYVLRETKRIKSQFSEFHDESDDEDGKTNRFPSLRKYFIRPLLTILRYLKNFLSFNLDVSSDDSMESRRSYSLKSAHSTYQTGENHLHRIHHPTHNINPNEVNRTLTNTNGNHMSDQDVISLRSFSIDEHIKPPQKSVTRDNVSHGRSSLRKNIIPVLENHSSISSSASNIMEFTSGDDEENNSTMTSSNAETYSTGGATNNPGVNISYVQDQFRRQNYAAMKQRRAQIQRNLRAVFIYPFSYIVVWGFPIVADISQTHHEIVHGPIVWLSYIDTFIRPMSCLVHAFVFIFKEKPWRFSWHRVESNVLVEKYMLRGEISEEEIYSFCHSDMGRRGWYYRSTWNKKGCWKHQPQAIKRGLWYIGRFFKCVFTLKKVSFYDNCNDEAYWNRYYYLDKLAPFPGSVVGSGSSLSSPSNNSSSNKHTMTERNGTQHRVIENSDLQSDNDFHGKDDDIVYVPFYWKLLRLLPMLHGIDLDELNRSVKLRYTNDEDDFVIPGLTLALKTNNNVNFTSKDNNIHNKATGSYTYEPSKGFNVTVATNPNHISANSAASNNNNTNNNNMNREKYPHHSNVQQEADGEIDLLAFLNS